MPSTSARLLLTLLCGQPARAGCWRRNRGCPVVTALTTRALGKPSAPPGTPVGQCDAIDPCDNVSALTDFANNYEKDCIKFHFQLKAEML